MTLVPHDRRMGDGLRRRLAWPLCVLLVLAANLVAFVGPWVTGRTSDLDRPTADGVVPVGGGLAVRAIGWGPESAAVTTDGVAWRALTGPAADRLPLTTPLYGPERRQACVPADRLVCYRTVPERLAVEESADGGATWRTAVSVSPGRQLFLARTFPASSGVARAVATQDLGVLAVTGGHVVVAASGPDGFLVRHVDGGWERVGFPALVDGGTVWTPGRLAARGTGIGRELLWSGALVLLGLAVAGLLARRHRQFSWAGAVAAGAGLLVVLWTVTGLGAFTAFADVRALAGGLAVVLVVWSVVAVFTGALRARVAGVLAGVSVAAVVTAMWPLLGWTAGTTDAYEPAHRAQQALTCSGVAVLLVLAAGCGVLERRRSSARPTCMSDDRRTNA